MAGEVRNIILLFDSKDYSIKSTIGIVKVFVKITLCHKLENLDQGEQRFDGGDIGSAKRVACSR